MKTLKYMMTWERILVLIWSYRHFNLNWTRFLSRFPGEGIFIFAPTFLWSNFAKQSRHCFTSHLYLRNHSELRNTATDQYCKMSLLENITRMHFVLQRIKQVIGIEFPPTLREQSLGLGNISIILSTSINPIRLSKRTENSLSFVFSINNVFLILPT